MWYKLLALKLDQHVPNYSGKAWHNMANINIEIHSIAQLHIVAFYIYRIGYNITMQDEICSRYKFRPSAKYVAMQPYKSYT